MEEMEAVKEWFVTHEGKRYGPVCLDDLKFEADRGALNPRLDMVWKNGMADWIPSGDLAGLFKRHEEAKPEARAIEDPPAEDPPENMEGEFHIPGDRAGAGRGTYFLACYVLPFAWWASLAFGMKFLEGKADPGHLMAGGLALCLLPLFLLIAAILKRFQNLGMSRAWFFGLFAPFLNAWVTYRLFACPPGYAHHKKLDPIGWLLAVLHWGALVIVGTAIAFAAYTLTQAAEGDPLRAAIEDSIETIGQALKAR